MLAGLDGNANPVVSAERAHLLEVVGNEVANVEHDRVLVAVDGPSGTGKSTFADELGRTLTDRNKTVVRASIDSFHRPRAQRYRLGKDSPEGYYRDSHDLPELRQHLLEPFATGTGPSGGQSSTNPQTGHSMRLSSPCRSERSSSSTGCSCTVPNWSPTGI